MHLTCPSNACTNARAINHQLKGISIFSLDTVDPVENTSEQHSSTKHFYNLLLKLLKREKLVRTKANTKRSTTTAGKHKLRNKKSQHTPPTRRIPIRPSKRNSLLPTRTKLPRRQRPHKKTLRRLQNKRRTIHPKDPDNPKKNGEKQHRHNPTKEKTLGATEIRPLKLQVPRHRQKSRTVGNTRTNKADTETATLHTDPTKTPHNKTESHRDQDSGISTHSNRLIRSGPMVPPTTQHQPTRLHSRLLHSHHMFHHTGKTALSKIAITLS